MTEPVCTKCRESMREHDFIKPENSYLFDVKTLTTALVEVEESKLDPSRLDDDDYEPPGISCGDAAAIIAALP